MSVAKGTEAPTSGNLMELAPVLPRDSMFMPGVSRCTSHDLCHVMSHDLPHMMSHDLGLTLVASCHLQSLPSRKTGLFPDSIPWTQPMSAHLISLPPPEESAQALIMKERRRRSSISTMFRKFSRKGSVGIFRRGEGAWEGRACLSLTHTTHTPHTHALACWEVAENCGSFILQLPTYPTQQFTAMQTRSRHRCVCAVW